MEEADYDDNIREHIVTASATVCWVMARCCLLRTKKTDDAQAKARLIRHANLWSTAAMAKEDAKPRQPRLRRKRLEAPPGPPWACGELVWAWLAGQSRGSGGC